MYENFNRSSRSLALDMKSPESVELFLRLIEHTDIVLENFGPGVLERWGVGYERMAQINPRLILLSISGYGQTGPRAQALAYGGTIASFLGLTQAYGYPPAVHFDYVAAAHGLYGVLLALEERERSGLGTWIDLGMIESGAATMGTLLLEYTVNGRDSAPRGNRIPGALLSEVVRCMGDDSWLAVEVRDRDALDRLATAVGSDPGADAGAVAAALATWTSHRTADAAMRALQRAGVAAGVVQNAQDVTRDVQLRERGAIVELPHPDLGPIEFAALPYRFDGERPAVRSRTPRLGEHNAEILVDWLGMSEADADGWAWPPAP